MKEWEKYGQQRRMMALINAIKKTALAFNGPLQPDRMCDFAQDLRGHCEALVEHLKKYEGV